jgi:DNA-binding transcriptional MerR regulator
MTGGHRASGNVSIGQVLDELRADFPDVSPSKIRFLEAEGLIQPLRASSGYRRFAVADIERLRFILTAQRDEYLPLRVIKERLDALDAGGASQVPAVSMTRSELLNATGAAEEFLAELEDYGLVRRARSYTAQALSVVRSAVLLAEYGIKPRHLRALKAAAEREASLVEQAVAPLVRQKGSREPALRAARDIAAHVAAIHGTLVDDGLSEAGLASQAPAAGTPAREPGHAPGLRSASGR